MPVAWNVTLNGKGDRVAQACELHQRAVADQFHGATAILDLFRLDQPICHIFARVSV